MAEKIDPTINTYNLYDGIYDLETTDFWKHFPQSTIQSFIKNLPGKRVLNLGSGPGRDAVLLRNAGLSVTCLDASTKMVERTKNLGFESINTDFREMDFPNNYFSGVWAFTSLLHVPKKDTKDVITKIHSILENKGTILIGMIEGSYEGNLKRDSMPDTYRYFKYYEEEELKKLVVQIGFEFKTQERYKPRNKTYISQIYVKE